MIKIPRFFHDILGEFQTKVSLAIICLFVLISGLAIGILGFEEWRALSIPKQLVAWLLFIDISGGVMANLSKGTDLFYEQHPGKRWLFIFIHIQPILISWSMEISIHYGVVIYAYTLVSAVCLNLMRTNSWHSLVAGGFTAIGLLLVAYFAQEVPFFASTLFIFYVFKVLFSFSVFHHRGEQNGV